MRHRTADYAIDYLNADGSRRGREVCTLTSHQDGRRTLRARSEIDAAEVLRDVVYTVDAAFRPIDALLRVSVQDRTVGTGWFVFDETGGACEALTAAEGRVSQRVATPGWPKSFLTHAVAADVWHGAGLAPVAGPQPITPLLSASPLHNGASGPMLGRWPLQGVWLGRDVVEVPAGRFEAFHVRYEEPTGELFLDTWCTADDDRIMLRMHYPPYGSSYVLATLARS